MPLTHKTNHYRITSSIRNIRDLIQFAKAVFYSFKVRRNHCYSYATCAAATTAGKAKSTTATNFSINNEMYTKAATDNLWDCTAITSTATTGFAKILFMLNTAGAATVLKGEEKAAQVLAAWPPTSEGLCAVGGVEIGSGYAGSTLWGTHHNLAWNPADDCLKYGL